MADSQELERLFVFFMGNDDHLEKMYSQVVERARSKAQEVGKAFETGFNKGFANAGTNVEASARKQEKAIDDVSKAAREMTATLTTTATRQTKAVDEVKDAFEKLRNESAGLRNAVEAGAEGTKTAIARFKELEAESLKQAGAFARNSKEYRQFTQVAAQASRSVATLEGRVSKLGFSANNAVGVTQALRMHTAFLGSAGSAAADSMGLLGMAFSGFARNGPGLQNTLQAAIRGFTRLNTILPLVAAGGVALATAALIKMGKAASETADLIDKASQSAGFTAEAFQEVAFALEQSGVSIDQTRQGLNDFNARLGQAAAGSAGVVAAYKKLGVAIREENGAIRGSEEVFNDLIGALSSLPSAAEQAATGGLVFGEEFSRRVIPALNAGAEGFQGLRDQARSLGLILSGDSVKSLVEFKDQMNILERQFKTARTEIVASFIPVITRGLIPILQDQVVPRLQDAAQRLADMADRFFDAGQEGISFRNHLAVIGAGVQTVGQFLFGLGQMSVGLIQVLSAPFAALGSAIGYASVGLEAMLDVYRRALSGDFSGFLKSPAQVFREAGADMAASIESALQQGAQGLANLADGGKSFFGAFDFETLRGNWRDLLSDISTGSATTVRAFTQTGDAATDLSNVLTGLAVAPAGSLAALRQEVSAAREAFENATTEAARAAANERIAIAEAEIAAITAIYAAADPFAPAKVWVARLGAELEFGLKTAAQVFDLITPRIEELREQASQALVEFGVDSPEYTETVGKLRILEDLLGKVQSTAKDIVIEPTVNFTDAGNVDLTGVEMIATVLEAPLAAVRFLLHQMTSDASDDFRDFRVSYDDWVNNVALGANSVQSAMNVQADAVNIFLDTLKAMTAAGEDTQTLFDALSRNPAFSMTLMTAPGGAAAPDLGLIEAALARQAQAWSDVQSAMTETAIVEAGERYNIATEEVERLRSLYAAVDVEAPQVDPGKLIREDLARELTVAALAAEAFGTQSELTAKQVALFEAAILRLLAADPTADISDLVLSWETLSATLVTGEAAMQNTVNALVTLGQAEAALSALTGELPDKYAELRWQFISLAAAGDITVERLEEVLAVIRELENTEAAQKAIQGLTDALNLGGAMVNGLTAALEGIRDGDVRGALGGLTQLGVAIGTAIGGPAVGALVGAIGQGLQSLVGLGQVISDIFTGDSPARRELADTITQTVAGAIKTGIMEGVRGADGWQDSLRTGVQEAVYGALVDAFIQAAIVQATIQPFIDEFTRILNRQGEDAAFNFLEANIGRILAETEAGAARIVAIFDKYFPDGAQASDAINPVVTGVFELPSATVSALTNPQASNQMSEAAVTIGDAGAAMLEAAAIMRQTFSTGLKTASSGRGIDAARAA